MANSGAPQNSEAGQADPAASAGGAGAFADLMAQALSAGSQLPKGNPLAGQIDVEIGGNNETPLPKLPAQLPNPNAGKNPLKVVSLQELAGHSVAPLVTGTKPDAQGSVVTVGKSVEKGGENTKGPKDSPSQPGQASAPPGLPGIPTNQIIAAVPLPNFVPVQPVKLKPDPASAGPKLPAPDEGPALAAAAGQTKKISGTVPNVSTSRSPLKEVVSAGEPPTAAMSSSITTKVVGTTEKNEEPATPLDASVNLSQVKLTPDRADHPSTTQIAAGERDAESPPDTNGISIAKQDITVKHTEKANNIAGQTEKVLPGNASLAAQASSRLPVSVHPEQVAATAQISSDAPEDSSAASVMTVQAAPTVSAPNAPVVERMQEMMTLNAVRLSDSGNNSMQVVIKPDSGTELSLELRQHGGSVEVQAVLQQGDFHHLNQQWQDLQHRLGLRGIQLAPLADNATGSHAGADGSFQQRQQKTAEAVDNFHFAAAPATPIVPTMAQAPVIEPARAPHGWETWA
ncbi:MAG TPA: hypothetical protein VGN23_02165 [Verrucomicrobiae bacterium]|jgi:hypothetical protein